MEKIYACDIEPKMVVFLTQRVKDLKLENVIPISSTPQDSKLPQLVDIVLCATAYHHIDADGRVEYFKKLRSHVKESGKLCIIDFKPDAKFGPPESMRISPQEVITELQKGGWKQIMAQETEKLDLDTPHSYTLMFTPTSK